uniref:Rx N-terminal domain-containing protein n=1 Tax=Oryza punctata TaxID=4537 RepID=A0A0E0LGI3_ORYPU
MPSMAMASRGLRRRTWLLPPNDRRRGRDAVREEAAASSRRRQRTTSRPGRETHRVLKMEEIVGSAIVHETVNKIMSGMIDKFERKSSTKEHMERLEMAQIKLEFALETSNKWQITGGPLLRWQKKLKRAAEGCDDTLRKCRQRLQEEKEGEQQVRNSSFPRRIAHATKSLISSIFHSNIDELSRSAVRRFEWYADGANDFLKSVESGGAPRRYLFFDPLIGHLLAGETLEYKSVQGNKQHLFIIRPNNIAERGLEAKLIFVYHDGSAPENNFYLGMILQLSDSTNIIGTTIKCLQLFTPHFKSSTETVRKELTQLPTQDFSWVSHARLYHWDNIHNITTEWFRPNPLCCKHHGQKVCGSGHIYKTELPSGSLEPVIAVSLRCQLSLLGFREQGTIVDGKPSLKEFPDLKVHLIYTPHGSSEDIFPAIESSVVEMINGDEQHCLHTNIALEQMEKIMLPKTVDCFRQNAKARVYQMLWKSKHGGAYLQAVKATMNTLSTGRTIRGAKKTKLLRQHDHWTQSRADVISDFFNLWAAHAPVQLQGSILDWIQKEKEARGNSVFVSGTLWVTELVASVVISEVNRISTFLIDKHNLKSGEEDDLERLEMARIKMEAALEVSSR